MISEGLRINALAIAIRCRDHQRTPPDNGGVFQDLIPLQHHGYHLLFALCGRKRRLVNRKPSSIICKTLSRGLSEEFGPEIPPECDDE